MITLKNPFSRSTTQPEPPSQPTPSVTAAIDALRGKQMLRGRTKARVESVTAELDTAELQLERARQALADDDLEDPTTAMESMAQAEERVRMLKSALTVAQHKDDEARAAEQDAKHAAEVEGKVAAVTHLKTVAEETDQKLADLERHLTSRLCPAIDGARLAMGPGIESNFVTKVTLEFGESLKRACRQLVKSSNLYSCLQDGKVFSSYVPDPESIRTQLVRERSK